jgi:Mn2+/Fe2+ NRAMP family transporter
LFIVLSTAGFLLIGRPVNVLIIVGALNGLILPLALTVILIASQKPNLMGEGYRHPRWMLIAGWLVMCLLTIMSLKTIAFDLSKIWK